MKKLLVLSLSVLFFSCGVSNRYLLTDSNSDKNFLKKYIDSMYKIGTLESTKPIVVFDGIPRRFDIELKEKSIEYSKSEIEEVYYLKNNAAIAIYGESAENGVILVKTIYDKTSSPKKAKPRKKAVQLENILYIHDGIEIKKESLNSINPNGIQTVQVLKNEAAKKMYTDKSYDGVIIIKSYNFVVNEYRKQISDASSDYKNLIETISIEDEYEKINYSLNDTLLIPKKNRIKKLLNLEKSKIIKVDVIIRQDEKSKVNLTTK